MAVQNYKERVVYPSGMLNATPEQFAKLVMGEVGFSLTLDFAVGEKIILDEGVMIYRKGENSYKLVGTSDKVVKNESFDERLPVDLSDILDGILEMQLGSVTLLM